MLFAMTLQQQDWINSLGWMLLHSLWQHALIALCCALLLFFGRQYGANSRYLIALGSVVLAVFTSIITFYKYLQASTEIIMRPLQTDKLIPLFNNSDSPRLIDFINAHIDGITFIWLFGIILYGFRMLFDYRACQHLKNKHLTNTPEKWQKVCESLAQKIGIKSNIELRISVIAMTPCVIGYLRPVVLLPMKILLGMNQQQIEMILLHELAHIRRQDYLVGLLQTLIKAFFFFNPFLHWISSQMDKEREHACDDIAVAISQNPLLFANTLKELAEMSIKQNIAMNIIGNKLLLSRITRLFKPREKRSTTKNGLVASLLILITSLVVAVCVNAAPNNDNNKIISLDVSNTAVQEVMAEVNKKCGTNEVLSSNNNDEVTLLLEDISCDKAIQLLKDFVAEESVPK